MILLFILFYLISYIQSKIYTTPYNTFSISNQICQQNKQKVIIDPATEYFAGAYLNKRLAISSDQISDKKCQFIEIVGRKLDPKQVHWIEQPDLGLQKADFDHIQLSYNLLIDNLRIFWQHQFSSKSQAISYCKSKVQDKSFIIYGNGCSYDESQKSFTCDLSNKNLPCNSQADPVDYCQNLQATLQQKLIEICQIEDQFENLEKNLGEAKLEVLENSTQILEPNSKVFEAENGVFLDEIDGTYYHNYYSRTNYFYPQRAKILGRHTLKSTKEAFTSELNLVSFRMQIPSLNKHEAKSFCTKTSHKDLSNQVTTALNSCMIFSGRIFTKFRVVQAGNQILPWQFYRTQLDLDFLKNRNLFMTENLPKTQFLDFSMVRKEITEENLPDFSNLDPKSMSETALAKYYPKQVFYQNPTFNNIKIVDYKTADSSGASNGDSQALILFKISKNYQNVRIMATMFEENEPPEIIFSTSGVVKSWASDLALTGNSLIVNFDRNFLEDNAIFSESNFRNFYLMCFSSLKQAQEQKLIGSLPSKHYQILMNVPVLTVSSPENLKFTILHYIPWDSEHLDQNTYGEYIPYCSDQCQLKQRVLLKNLMKLYCSCDYHNFDRPKEMVYFPRINVIDETLMEQDLTHSRFDQQFLAEFGNTGSQGKQFFKTGDGENFGSSLALFELT